MFQESLTTSDLQTSENIGPVLANLPRLYSLRLIRSRSFSIDADSWSAILPRLTCLWAEWELLTRANLSQALQLHSLKIVDLPERDWPAAVKQLSTLPSLHSVCVSFGSSFRDIGFPSFVDVTELLGDLKSLTSFKMEQHAVTVPMLPLLVNLRELDLFCGKQWTTASIHTLIENCPKLEHLRISGIFKDNVSCLGCLQELQTLDISKLTESESYSCYPSPHCGKFAKASFPKLLSAGVLSPDFPKDLFVPTLTAAKMWLSTAAHEAAHFLEELGNRCPRIEKLEVLHTSRSKPKAKAPSLDTFLSYFTQLKHLQVVCELLITLWLFLFQHFSFFLQMVCFWQMEPGASNIFLSDTIGLQSLERFNATMSTNEWATCLPWFLLCHRLRYITVFVMDEVPADPCSSFTQPLRSHPSLLSLKVTHLSGIGYSDYSMVRDHKDDWIDQSKWRRLHSQEEFEE